MKTNNKYQNGKIYKVVDTGYNKCYYGSTVQRLTVRMAGHRRDYNKFKNDRSIGYTTIYSIFDDFGVDNCKIELVELYPCISKEELHRKEGEYIKNNECVNKLVAGRNKKEYNELNKDKFKEYYEQNKHKYNEYRKLYYEEHKDEFKTYREINKDRLSENNKKYRHENKLKLQAYKKQYREEHKDKFQAYYEQNKGRLNDHNREYYERNKTKILESRKERMKNKQNNDLAKAI